MREISRKIASYFAVAYLSVGLVLGSLLFAAIPAMNVLGWGYYTVLWPAFICHGTKVCKGAPPVPRWAFSFPAAKAGAPQ